MRIEFFSTSSKLIKRKKEYLQLIEEATQIVENFANLHDLEVGEIAKLVKKVKIYDEHDRFSYKLAEMFDLSPAEILPSFVGTIVDKVLYLMVPEYYFNLNPTLNKSTAYQQLIAHEIAHQYHVFLLNENEEKMGPIWFFEGFATTVANQYEFSNRMYNLIKKEFIN